MYSAALSFSESCFIFTEFPTELENASKTFNYSLVKPKKVYQKTVEIESNLVLHSLLVLVCVGKYCSGL